MSDVAKIDTITNSYHVDTYCYVYDVSKCKEVWFTKQIFFNQ
ncbi:hypothetical protein AC26_2181 [Escherichia coli 1-176-05_S3_C2]|nr:hypothetical protein AC26_2181 [Escherichia coli 1-176-05_S3_C2]